jgi:hypothetical protein
MLLGIHYLKVLTNNLPIMSTKNKSILNLVVKGGNILDSSILFFKIMIHYVIYIHINNLVFNLKINLIMPHQLIALIILIISNNHVSYLNFFLFILMI